MNRVRMGRPPRDADPQALATLSIRVPIDLFKAVKTAAIRQNVPVSEWVRDALAKAVLHEERLRDSGPQDAAAYPSGQGAVCKTAQPGSTPGAASN